LVARVNAGARRVGRNTIRQPFSFGSATIDPFKRQATAGDQVHTLTHRELELIAYFASHPNETLSREELYSACWPGSSTYIGRTVDQRVLKVRKKLGKAVIENIYGVGFCYRSSAAGQEDPQ
jgi:DNA-binding response OmpR family regulator